MLTARLHALPAENADGANNAGSDEAMRLWSALGIADAQQVPELSVEAVRALRTI